jgi:hypothetical protein
MDNDTIISHVILNESLEFYVLAYKIQFRTFASKVITIKFTTYLSLQIYSFLNFKSYFKQQMRIISVLKKLKKSSLFLDKKEI